MPRLTDKNEIRTRLRRDPAWSVYALGDLAPPMFSKTLWFAPDLTLVVQDYGTAILFAIGPGSVREALECVAAPVHLQVQRDALDEVARHAAVSSPRLMWRMTWTGGRLASPGAVTTRLGASDVPALQALIRTSASRRSTDSLPANLLCRECTSQRRAWQPLSPNPGYRPKKTTSPSCGVDTLPYQKKASAQPIPRVVR